MGICAFSDQPATVLGIVRRHGTHGFPQRGFAAPAAPAPRRKATFDKDWIVKNKKLLQIGGGVLFALVLVAGIIISLRTNEGTLVVTVNEADAEVQVLSMDDKVEITRKGEKGPLTIGVDPGEHRLKVQKDGFEIFTDNFEVESGGKTSITAKLKPAKVKTEVAEKQRNPLPEDAGRPTDDVGGWVSLFNGKDLTGWKPDPEDRARWDVKDGILIGSGAEIGHLFTQRGDFENFRFRIEAKINDFGNSGQYFRTRFEKGYPAGYEAQINSTHPDPAKTGTLYGLATVTEMLVKPDEWFTQEVIAEGNHIRILVNGKQVVDFVDAKNSYTKGHLALQHHKSAGGKDTVVQFRKIEVKELTDGRGGTAPATLDALQGNWVVEGVEEVNGRPMPEITEKRFVFSDHKMTMTRKNNGTPGKYEGTFTADAASGHFDFTGTGPGGNPVAWRGIYERDGDSLTLCYKYVNDDGTTRPTEFQTDAKDDAICVLIRLRLDSQAPSLKGPPQDAVRFEGHAYKFFADVLTWQQARSRCEEMEGTWPSSTSAAENRFLAELAKKGISQLGKWMASGWAGPTNRKKAIGAGLTDRRWTSKNGDLASRTTRKTTSIT